MKREFLPVKDYPAYNQAVDIYMRNSKVYNSGSEQVQRTFWDRSTIESKLFELENNLIPASEQKVKDIEEKFAENNRKRLRTGHEEYSTMPEPMLTDYYRERAQITVSKGEVEELQKWLQVYTDHDQMVEDAKVLQYGLRGHGVFHGTRASNPALAETLKTIDNQFCELTEEGLLIIKDDRSPYNGMLVSDYRKLCKIWQEDRRKAEEQNYKLLVEQYREQGLSAPKPPVKAPTKVNKSSLPKWPQWAKKYVSE